MESKTKVFITRLKDKLDERDITQRDLAKRINVTEQCISNYMQGVRLPKWELICEIANVLNCSPHYLLGMDEIKKPQELIDYTNKTYKVPILSEVRAGQPTLIMDSNILGYERVDDSIKNSGEIFGLRVKGDSMSPKFSEGDIVIVRRQSDVDDGQIAIVLVNGDEATIKKIKKSVSGITLIPLNNAYEPLFFTNDEIITRPVQIIGRVVELHCKF